MLVFYSGWGYWEGDCDELNTTVDLSPAQKECSLFELPKNAAKEVTFQRETFTGYLLAYKYSEIKGPKVGCAEDARFILCEEPDFTAPDPYLYIKRITKKFTTDDIQVDVLNEDAAKNLSETERNSMLKLIIGMAIDAYAYDPASKKSSLTGNNKNSLSAKLQIHGINISDDTIRKYLKDAKNIL